MRNVIFLEDNAEFVEALQISLVDDFPDIRFFNDCESFTRNIPIFRNDYPTVFVIDRYLGKNVTDDIVQKFPQYGMWRVIILTGHPSIESSVIAIKSKVFDYLIKPVSVEDIRLSIKGAFLDIYENKNKYSNNSDIYYNYLIESRLSRTDTIIIAIERCTKIGIDASITNISTIIPQSIPTIHRGAKDVVDLGYAVVENKEQDQRVKLLSLTKKGTARLDYIKQKIEKHFL